MPKNAPYVMVLEHYGMVQKYVRGVTEKGTFLYLLGRMEDKMETNLHNYKGFIKLYRSNQVLNLLEKRPSAFTLLTLIALRARRTNEVYFDELQIGEAYIGDYKSYKVSMQIYRTDKKFLEKYDLATFKTTTKGTIARLIKPVIFDINEEEITNKITINHATTSVLTTTNKNENNINNEKNIKSRFKKNPVKSLSYKGNYQIVNPKSFSPSNAGETAALETWKKLEPFNPLALQTTYLWAHRSGIPPSLFYQFTSEILQDDSIKNNGAVFRKKVEDFLKKAK